MIAPQLSREMREPKAPSAGGPIITNVKTRAIDWTEVILDLRRCGMSHREIAEECEANGHDWVHRLLNIPGTQPKFHNGTLLLGLWLERTGKRADQVPVF